MWLRVQWSKKEPEFGNSIGLGWAVVPSQKLKQAHSSQTTGGSRTAGIMKSLTGRAVGRNPAVHFVWEKWPQRGLYRVQPSPQLVYLLIFWNYSWFTVLCKFLLYRKASQSYVHTHTHIYKHSFSIIFHHVLSQEIGYRSLYCTVGPHCFPC